MIHHITCIANTAREHDRGYGFLLTQVFESFGVKMQKKVGVQTIDDIASSTLMGCGYTLVEGLSTEQGVRTPFTPVSDSSSARPFVESVLHDQAKLKFKLSEVKDAWQRRKLSMPNAMKIFLCFSLLSPPSSPLLTKLPEHPHPLFLWPVL